MSNERNSERERIDMWLKLVCLFKQRSDATDACKGGKVKINGQSVKPAHDLKVGDVVELTGDRYRKVVVLEMPHGNVSKEKARTLYRDETPEQPKHDPLAAILAPARDRGTGRPTKRDRREIDKWKW